MNVSASTKSSSISSDHVDVKVYTPSPGSATSGVGDKAILLPMIVPLDVPMEAHASVEFAQLICIMIITRSFGVTSGPVGQLFASSFVFCNPFI